MWYVLEGHFRFRADEEILDAPADSFVFVPRGTAHCFQNIGGVPRHRSRLLDGGRGRTAGGVGSALRAEGAKLAIEAGLCYYHAKITRGLITTTRTEACARSSHSPRDGFLSPRRRGRSRCSQHAAGTRDRVV